MLKFYGALLEKRPVITKSITGGIISCIGDAITQIFIEKIQFDLTRNINFTLINCFLGGPAFHTWYCKVLPKLQTLLFPNVRKIVKVFNSMLLDELLFGPIIYTSFYMVHTMVTERDFSSLASGFKTCRQKLWQTVWTSWKFWPACTMMNLYFMPLKYQVLMANFAGFFWNMFMSYIAAK